MDHHSGLNRFLPNKFLFVIPLYIGVELVLSVAILNKAGGIYGILSLLTGHHLNFWQWIYNLLAFSTIPFYVSALFHLQDNSTNLRKMCLACSVYLLDTITGFAYTVYFIYFWVSHEEGPVQKQVSSAPASFSTRADDLSQSASPSRELFLTVSGVLFQTVTRIYFCFIVLSFTKKLLLQNLRNQRDHGHDSLADVAEHSSFRGKFLRFSYALEMRAKDYFQEIFA